MKRWIAALLAVLFLSTATLHALSHHGLADADCGVCHVQQASLPAAPAPAVAAAPVLRSDLAQAPAPRPRATRPVAAAARAPPASLA